VGEGLPHFDTYAYFYPNARYALGALAQGHQHGDDQQRQPRRSQRFPRHMLALDHPYAIPSRQHEKGSRGDDHTQQRQVRPSRRRPAHQTFALCERDQQTYSGHHQSGEYA